VECENGAAMAGWAPNARTVLGIGPVAVVEQQGLVFFFLGLEEVVTDDGAVGVEELVADVGEDGGAARRDAPLGDENEEAGEELGNVDAGVEFGEFREKVGGKVIRVVLDVHWKRNGSAGLGVAETSARVNRQAGEAAALAVGIAVVATRSICLCRDCDRIDDGSGANACCVHKFLPFFGGNGVYTPHSMHEFENKRVAK